MRSKKYFLSLFFAIGFTGITFGQLPTKIVNGILIIDDGALTPSQQVYTSLSTSLDAKLKANPNDTTSLFYGALLLDRQNYMLAKPSPGEKGAWENLQRAKTLVEKAVSLKMQDFKLKVLRAQVYKDLCYRFGGDESWQFNIKQIAERKTLFNSYKKLANKYYDELADVDKNNAYDYQKLKETSEYPIKS